MNCRTTRAMAPGVLQDTLTRDNLYICKQIVTGSLASTWINCVEKIVTIFCR